MIISIFGLAISFVGTIMLAFSIKKGKVEMYMDHPEEMESAARFNRQLFRWGLTILAFGFLLQIWGEICQKASGAKGVD